MCHPGQLQNVAVTHRAATWCGGKGEGQACTRGGVVGSEDRNPALLTSYLFLPVPVQRGKEAGKAPAFLGSEVTSCSPTLGGSAGPMAAEHTQAELGHSLGGGRKPKRTGKAPGLHVRSLSEPGNPHRWG